MITMKELGAPIRQWVPDWLGLICIFIVILPVTMLNGSYTGSMLEVSNTLGTNTEDITMGYYAAAAGMAVSYPDYPEDTGSLLHQILIVGGFSRPVLPKLDLCPLPERRHIDRL